MKSEMISSIFVADDIEGRLGIISADHVDAGFSERVIILVVLGVVFGVGKHPYRDDLVAGVQPVDQLFSDDVRVVLNMYSVNFHVVNVGQERCVVVSALEVHCPDARQAARFVDFNKLVDGVVVKALHEALFVYLFTKYHLVEPLETTYTVVLLTNFEYFRRLDLDEEQHLV